MTTTTDTTKQAAATIAALSSARRQAAEAFDQLNGAAGALGLNEHPHGQAPFDPGKAPKVADALRAAGTAWKACAANLAVLGVSTASDPTPAPMTDAEVLERAAQIAKRLQSLGLALDAETLPDLHLMREHCSERAPACTVSDIIGGGR